MKNYLKKKLCSWYESRYAVWTLTTVSGDVYKNMTKSKALEVLELFSDALYIERECEDGNIRFYPQQK